MVRNSIVATTLVILLGVPMLALPQDTTTIKITLRVEPYLEMLENDVAFISSADNPGVFDSGWNAVALANCPWQASIVLPAASVWRGPELSTSYKVYLRYNGKERIVEVSERDRRKGAVSISAAETPHNGVIEMRFVAKVSSADAQQGMILPPAGIGLTMSTMAF